MDEVYEIYDKWARRRAVELVWRSANDALDFLEMFTKNPDDYRVQSVKVASK